LAQTPALAPTDRRFAVCWRKCHKAMIKWLFAFCTIIPLLGAGCTQASGGSVSIFAGGKVHLTVATGRSPMSEAVLRPSGHVKSINVIDFPADIDRPSTLQGCQNARLIQFELGPSSHGNMWGNQAASYFSRLRRGEMGHFHHVSGPYLLRYAQEASWREDARRVDNGSQMRRVTELALKRGPSVDFAGYYQRHIKTAA